MTIPHSALVLLAAFLPLQGFLILVALRRGRREELAWRVSGTIALAFFCVGFSLWPTSPEQIFGSIGGALHFFGGMLLMGAGTPFLRRCVAVMPQGGRKVL